MKLAFYKGKFGGLVDRAICLRTRSQFAHVELILDGVEAPAGTIGTKTTTAQLAFTSTLRDHVDGTRFKWIEFDPDKWQVVELKKTLIPADLSDSISKSASRRDENGPSAIMPYFVWI